MRVSILIPNFNNGRQSSRDQQTDLIGDLCQSLHDTLADDPVELELIAYDDGSTDDSLQTLREWSQRTWRCDQPFLKLIEREHCGVLAKTANVLVRESKGDILVRLDGDTQMLTPRWASLLCEVFDQGPPRLGVIGPKQLRPDGRIHAFGDWLLHPKGYHHIAAGLPADAVNQPMEVDHVMGCFYCCKRAVYDELEGYDENILRGQTVDFGLRARLKGWSCWAIPQVEYVHRHGLRSARTTKADTQQGVAHTLDVFREKWGFDRIAPDLDAVRRKYAGTPLLWNAAVFGKPLGRAAANGQAQQMTIENSEWQKYTQDGGYRQFLDVRINLTGQILKQVGKPEQLAVVGCGAGLLVHLLAQQGLNCVGMDTDAAAIALARQCVANQSYPADKPRFVHQTDAGRLPMDDGQVELALVYDQIEKHGNPVGLLREVGRVVKAGGFAVLVTRRPDHALPTVLETEHRYHPHELIGQLGAIVGWQLVNDPRQTGANQPTVAVLKKL